MQFYRHDLGSPEDYLHHRPPYLLVERIVSIDDSDVVTEKEVGGDDSCLQGHFPGAPIFPGAMMQELSTQSAGVLIAARYNPMREFDTHDPFANEFALGVLVGVDRARFRGFARPGDALRTHVKLTQRVDQLFEFSARITVGESLIARSSFRLTNIRSSVLQGPAQAN